MNARALSVFRLYQLFNGIAFTGPIWAVYLLSRGLTLTQFGVVEACLHVGMLAAQVPTGALADALGRRRLLMSAGLFTAMGELGYVYAPGFGLICLAGAVHGVSFALRTGADEAYLFDALAHDDAEAQFPRMLGGMWAVFQFSGALSYFAGGAIASYSRPLAFWLTAGCALAASVIVARLPDDAAQRPRGHSRRVAAQGLRALRHSPRLATLTLGWSVYWAAVTTWWLYVAPLLERRGASDAELGALLGGALLVGAACSWLGGRIADVVPFGVALGVSAVLSVVAFIVPPELPGLVLPAIVLLALFGVPDVLYVTLSTSLQRNTRSEFRATSLSIAECGFSIQMLWLFPLAGAIVQHSGFGLGYGLCACLVVVATALFAASRRLPGLDDMAEPEPAAA
jgi:predicted MFS family arabinose efflux permease